MILAGNEKSISVVRMFVIGIRRRSVGIENKLEWQEVWKQKFDIFNYFWSVLFDYDVEEGGFGHSLAGKLVF